MRNPTLATLDADQWVRDFKETGASHLVFYDKWIDGLVFHETKTTGFKTKRDFVRELAAAGQRGGLPLVFHFNAVSDGNPEFNEWSLIGRDGNPIVFGARWPTRYQTLHSPFHQKCIEQVRELLNRGASRKQISISPSVGARFRLGAHVPSTLAVGHANKTIALGVPAHWFLGHGALHAFALTRRFRQTNLFDLGRPVT